MGDFYAKIGSDNAGREQVMGRHGDGEINASGELFVDMYAFNSMVIGSSVSPHERRHKATGVSPDHYTENQIDHICRCGVRPPLNSGQTEMETQEI